MPPSGDLSVLEIDGVTVATIEIEGLMGVLEVNQLMAQLEALVNDGVTRLVLDFEKVRYAGSAALGMLMALHKRLEKSGGMLILTNTQPIAALLKVAKTQAVFKVAKDLNAAVAMGRK
jgi:anti-anti-sigma factor